MHSPMATMSVPPSRTPFKSGFIAIVGRPNVGKSTLVNVLVGQKVSIVSPRPQTTRNRIQGIVNRKDAQIVLVDTPGIHRAETLLGRQMMNEVAQSIDGVDIASLIVDASEQFGASDRFALDWLRRFEGPAFLLLNKIDLIEKQRLLPLIDRYRKEHEFAEIFPISALKASGLDELCRAWVERLPENPPFFPTDQFTDQPERFLAAEFLREKAIRFTRQEVPHSVAVFVDSFEEAEKLLRIRATICVEREGQRGILIGKNGQMMKKIGTEARRDLEKALGIKIFLELHVKVLPGWRENPALVRQLDWHRELERRGEE